MILLALLACQSGSVPVDEPTPYIYEEADPPAPAWTTAEIEAAIQGVLDTALTYTAHPVGEAYRAILADQDEGGCPNYYTNENGTYWFDNCSSSAGTYFSGYGFYYTYYDYPSSGYSYNGWQLYGGSVVDTHAGHRFAASGGAYALVAESVDAENYHRIYQTGVNGTFTWDGPEADGTWLGTEVTPELAFYGYVLPDLDARAMVIDGGLSGLDGAVDTVVLDTVRLVDASWVQCTIEASGSISVRSPDGNWYDVLFDGPTDEYEPPMELCDGCGRAYYRGEPVGDVCVDFTVLTSWGDAPW